MTATMTTRRDPFADAVCREPGRLVRWWDVDARRDERELAAALCRQCPATTACATLANALGSDASGTYAGEFHEFAMTEQPPDDAMTEFLTIFGPTPADDPTPNTVEPKPLKYGRYWIHPAQLRIEYQETN